MLEMLYTHLAIFSQISFSQTKRIIQSGLNSFSCLKQNSIVVILLLLYSIYDLLMKKILISLGGILCIF